MIVTGHRNMHLVLNEHGQNPSYRFVTNAFVHPEHEGKGNIMVLGVDTAVNYKSADQKARLTAALFKGADWKIITVKAQDEYVKKLREQYPHLAKLTLEEDRRLFEQLQEKGLGSQPFPERPEQRIWTPQGIRHVVSSPVVE